jgi:cysteine-rich repeat protein
MMRLPSTVVLTLITLVSPAFAVDHPVGGDKLLLVDTSPTKRKVRFKARQDPNIDPAMAGNPTVLGATLEVTGSGPGDGGSGPITLGASNWDGLGNPAGSKGYKFSDPSRATGVRTVFFKPGASGGMLTVSGGGSNWPYAITQPQDTISARFTIGSDIYCAVFTTFDTNQPGRVVARNAPPPANCGPAPTTTTTTTTTSTSTTTTTTPPAGCGNGAVQGSEECDDGGTSNGDGCSATCQLESVNPALCAGIPTVTGTNLDTVAIASGLEAPVHIAAPRLDPSRVFVVEQPGRIQVVTNGVQQGTPFLAIEGIVRDTGSEEGLLSVAFDPDYETNRFFYVYYVNNAGDLVIARYAANPGNADDALEASQHIIITIPHPGAGNHNGGNLNFGPDGFLYAATGDGGGGGDPSDNAQNDAVRLGKLLRIDVDTDTVTNWAKGLRNPFRFSFDRANGDLYLGDVGQGSWEEIDYDPAPITAGMNYGWDDMEGRHCFEPSSGCLTAGRTLPVLEYCNSGCAAPADPDCTVAACSVFQSEKGNAVIGGFVYRGCALPDLQGEYFYSDTYNTWIKTFEGVSGGNAQNIVDRSSQLGSHTVTSFGEDTRGELYFTDYGTGEVYKIIPN